MSPPDPSDRAGHWESVYVQKAATAVSWYRGHLEVSLELLQLADLAPDSSVLDVGGGASTLVDDLLERGVARISVLDLSASALVVSRNRLGPRAAEVAWIVGDVTRVPLSAGAFSHWHDRAVMHFLTEENDLRAYAAQATRAIAAGGHAIIAGFAPDGPERCSGLPVARRAPEEIATILGPGFRLVDTRRELHRTPGGNEQAFNYALLRRLQGGS